MHTLNTCAIWNPWVESFKRYEEMSKFFYISRSRSRSRSRSMQMLNMSTRSSHHGLYTCAIWNPWVEYFKRYEEMSKFSPLSPKGRGVLLSFVRVGGRRAGVSKNLTFPHIFLSTQLRGFILRMCTDHDDCYVWRCSTSASTLTFTLILTLKWTGVHRKISTFPHIF